MDQPRLSAYHSSGKASFILVDMASTTPSSPGRARATPCFQPALPEGPKLCRCGAGRRAQRSGLRAACTRQRTAGGSLSPAHHQLDTDTARGGSLAPLHLPRQPRTGTGTRAQSSPVSFPSPARGCARCPALHIPACRGFILLNYSSKQPECVTLHHLINYTKLYYTAAGKLLTHAFCGRNSINQHHGTARLTSTPPPVSSRHGDLCSLVPRARPCRQGLPSHHSLLCNRNERCHAGDGEVFSV